MATERVRSFPPAWTARSDVKLPSLMMAVLVILKMKLMLRGRGFRGTLTWIRRRIEAVPIDAQVEISSVKRAEHVVALAAAFYPGRAQCLEQSLTLYYLLRRQGIGVKYCQGVQPHPFEAHAWLEYGGQVINDVAEHASQFLRLPDLLP